MRPGAPDWHGALVLRECGCQSGGVIVLSQPIESAFEGCDSTKAVVMDASCWSTMAVPHSDGRLGGPGGRFLAVPWKRRGALTPGMALIHHPWDHEVVCAALIWDHVCSCLTLLRLIPSHSHAVQQIRCHRPPWQQVHVRAIRTMAPMDRAQDNTSQHSSR